MRVTIYLLLLFNLWLVSCSTAIPHDSMPSHSEQPTAKTIPGDQKSSSILPTELTYQAETYSSRQEATSEGMRISPRNHLPCDRAEAGTPIDVAVPDDSAFLAGERFVKIWKLRNAGSCSWTSDYSVVWFSGAPLGLQTSERLKQVVAPGEEVEIAVEMMAPDVPGVYQSHWKMQNARGQLFGIGPEGESPFWVRIQVLPRPTSTPEAMVTPFVPTPGIYRTGSFELSPGDSLDLDSGLFNPEQGGDFVFEILDGNYWIKPQENSYLAVTSLFSPGYQDCRLAELAQEAILATQEIQGSFMCLRTNEGRLGSILLSLDFERNQLSGAYILWELP